MRLPNLDAKASAPARLLGTTRATGSCFTKGACDSVRARRTGSTRGGWRIPRVTLRGTVWPQTAHHTGARLQPSVDAFWAAMLLVLDRGSLFASVLTRAHARSSRPESTHIAPTTARNHRARWAEHAPQSLSLDRWRRAG